MQYISGLKDSRLVQINTHKDAKYRAVVLGLPEDDWASFDAAYPEYNKLFAYPKIQMDELRLCISDNRTALLATRQTSRRLLQRATQGFYVPVFLIDPAPVPVLTREHETARGFSVETMNTWQTPHKPSGTTVFFDNFDFADRPKLLAAADHVLGSSVAKTAPARDKSDRCLLIPSAEQSLNAQAYDKQLSDLRQMAKAEDAKYDVEIFQTSETDEWAQTDSIQSFITALETCDSVVTHNHPLGFLAILMGHKVVVTGTPFWAGYGLTHDHKPMRRQRTLTVTEMVAMTTFLLSRYVDETDSLIDPADNWRIPTTGVASTT